MTCTANDTCTSCAAHLFPTGDLCTDCFDPGCATCDVSDTCSLCLSGYHLLTMGEATTGYCEGCEAYHPACMTCSGTECLTCGMGYYADGSMTCKSCSNTQTGGHANCGSCTWDASAGKPKCDATDATHTGCEWGYYLNTDGGCTACTNSLTTLSPDCALCSSDRNDGWAGWADPTSGATF